MDAKIGAIQFARLLMLKHYRRCSNLGQVRFGPPALFKQLQQQLCTKKRTNPAAKVASITILSQIICTFLYANASEPTGTSPQSGCEIQLFSADAQSRTNDYHFHDFTFSNIRVEIRDWVRDPKVGCSPEVFDFMAKAAALAWRKHSAEAVTIPIELIHYFVDDEGKRTDQTGGYYPDRDVIVLAMNDKLLTLAGPECPIEGTVVLATAHEAAHKSQQARGMVMTPTRGAEYDDDAKELEAWETTLDVFKFLFPTSEGSFI
jgi:hypothetical protein